MAVDIQNLRRIDVATCHFHFVGLILRVNLLKGVAEL